ncbi:MAG: transcriptional regulator TyrR [Vibrio sp.]
MRLEVLCEDRLGITREILDILAAKQIDLRGIELEARGVIYLHCPEIDFDAFRDLLAQIRRIQGVRDVRKIDFMPSEQESSQLRAMLTHLPDALLSIDLNAQIKQANQAALALFGLGETIPAHKSLTQLVPEFALDDWQATDYQRFSQSIMLYGVDYLFDVIPVQVETDSNDPQITSAVVSIKPVVSRALKGHFYQVDDHHFDHFVGSSQKHQSLMQQAQKLSQLDKPLLIEGETGTGKEMLARACHQASPRKDKPFLVLSCASMPDDVAETELFGHAPGTFNHEAGHKGIFEQADQGTVFLDEIGEMSPHLQIKLLRFLQDGSFRRVGEEDEMHVDVRIIASTHQTLTELTEQGQFRADLYYRLNVLSLEIPPLRERPSDIAPLLERFIRQYAHQLNMQVPSYDTSLIEALCHYPWPGNIRQLENMVLRAMTQVESGVLTREHFNLPAQDDEPSFGLSTAIAADASLDEVMKSYEASVLRQLYQSFPSSRKLAKRLNVSHTSIANKLRDYQIR